MILLGPRGQKDRKTGFGVELGRTVFVSSKLRKEIAAYITSQPMKQGERALFYTQKNPKRGFTANTLTQYFLHLYRNVGIDGASSHSGRRSFATVLSSKGVGMRVLMRAMVHRNINTTIGYVAPQMIC